MTPCQLARGPTGVVHGVALELDGSERRTICGCRMYLNIHPWQRTEGYETEITCSQCRRSTWRARWGDKHPAPYIDVRVSRSTVELRSPGGAWVATSLDSITALAREMRDLGIQVREMR